MGYPTICYVHVAPETQKLINCKETTWTEFIKVHKTKDDQYLKPSLGFGATHCTTMISQLFPHFSLLITSKETYS